MHRVLLTLLVLAAALLAQPPAATVFPREANIHYDKYDETVLDILQPREPAMANRPGILVIHGGGWVQGAKESMVERFCVPFLEHGFVVANVEYRLAKVATAPAAVADVLKAAQWFAEHAAQYKVDPKRISVTGGSAGGHLALMVGMLPKGNEFGPTIKIAAIVNFYGITDVGDQITEGPHLRNYAVAWLPEQPNRLDMAKTLSPLTYVRKDVPPILTLHGDADPTVPYEQGVRLTDGLKAAGAKTGLITVNGGKHGFTPQEMAELWPQIFKFLKKHKAM